MTGDARGVLHAETERYCSHPSSVSNVERIGATSIETTIDGSVSGTLAARVAEYERCVDEVVLRAITAEQSVEAYLDFIRKAAG